MGKENSNTFIKWWWIPVSLIDLGLLFIPYFSSALQKKMDWKEVVAITIILAFYFVFVSFVLFFFCSKLQNRKSNDISSDENNDCLHDEWKLCCIDNYAVQLNQSKEFKIWTTNTILKEFRLKLAQDMQKKEINFGKNRKKDKKEIWICSYDLSTEVSEDGFKEIVKENLKNGIKYIEFYYEDDKTKEQTEQNRNIFKKFLKERPKVSEINVSFYPLKNSSKVINILPFLLGFIIFRGDNNYHLKNSFFSLRSNINETDSEPIYFRMPNCMSKAYNKYFEYIKNKENTK